MNKFFSIIVCLSFAVNFSQAASSPHGDKLNINCEICHDTLDWKKIKSSFNHDSTSFRLEGKHVSVDCKSCHTDLVFENAKSDCYSCHIPKHKKPQSFDCNVCHSQENWKSKIFDHSKTIFPLLGAHKETSCMKCHDNGFSNTSTACSDCHLDNYIQAKNPDHVALKYSKDCFKCHNTFSWKSQDFNHDKLTTFPLTGTHSGLDCTQCHKNGFEKTSKQCVSCHSTKYDRTTNPDHKTAGFSDNCEACHTTTKWRPSTFDHSKQSKFPLSGAHIKAKCTDCHMANYAATSTECVSCHLDDYEKAKNPDHVKAGFSKECENCHNTSGRSPSKFDHNKNTNFPLTDGHIGVKCKTCHTDSYKGRSTACVSCHLKDYFKTEYPNHVDGLFSKDCEKCHTMKTWKASIFDHNTATDFPLNNAHKNLDCKKCHTTIFVGTSTECVDCHRKDYDVVKKPDHATMKFSTQCTECHTDKNWKETSFYHDKQNFPIFTGKHEGVWVTCNDCHYNLSYFEKYSCIRCHEHSDKAKVDKIHSKVKNYEYTNSSCYTCHPKGKRI